MNTRRALASTVGPLVVVLCALVPSVASHAVVIDEAATYEYVDASPSDTITTVNGDVVVTTVLGPQAQFDATWTLWNYFATDGSGIAESSVQWNFSQPIYQLTVNYFAVESAASGGGADPQRFRTNLGAVDLALVADGGNRVSSTGELAPTQLEAAYVGDTAECTMTSAPNACSGTIELVFADGITSFTTYNGGLASSGFNGTGLALAADVADPAAPPVDNPEDPALADTGIDGTAASIAIVALVALATGTALLATSRRRLWHRAPAAL
ncbi:hypothetical protein [Microcella sp.]|uniref:hypothetical protein n=1 Tax=Microcella sp. TaxID=1913979 RepID=UPI003918E271